MILLMAQNRFFKQLLYLKPFNAFLSLKFYLLRTCGYPDWAQFLEHCVHTTYKEKSSLRWR